MNERQEVSSRLLITGGHAPTMVDLGAESTSAAPQRFGFRTAVFLGAPAACWCARITVESKMSHSKSGSCKASNTRCQTPLRDQRSKRFQTVSHLPNRSGRSRHG